MYKLLKTAVVAFAVVACSFGLQAQESFAYVNTADLLSGMTAFKEAESQMQTYSQQKENELTRKMEAYQTAVTTLQGQIERGEITELQKQTKVQEITQMEQDIQNFRINAEVEVARKQEEYLTPLRDKALSAIQAVAAENGYTYVFDLSTGVLLTYPPEDDITNLVKAKLP